MRVVVSSRKQKWSWDYSFSSLLLWELERWARRNRVIGVGPAAGPCQCWPATVLGTSFADRQADSRRAGCVQLATRSLGDDWSLPNTQVLLDLKDVEGCPPHSLQLTANPPCTWRLCFPSVLLGTWPQTPAREAPLDPVSVTVCRRAGHPG